VPVVAADRLRPAGGEAIEGAVREGGLRVVVARVSNPVNTATRSGRRVRNAKTTEVTDRLTVTSVCFRRTRLEVRFGWRVRRWGWGIHRRGRRRRRLNVGRGAVFAREAGHEAGDERPRLFRAMLLHELAQTLLQGLLQLLLHPRAPVSEEACWVSRKVHSCSHAVTSFSPRITRRLGAIRGRHRPSSLRRPARAGRPRDAWITARDRPTNGRSASAVTGTSMATGRFPLVMTISSPVSVTRSSSWRQAKELRRGHRAASGRTRIQVFQGSSRCASRCIYGVETPLQQAFPSRFPGLASANPHPARKLRPEGGRSVCSLLAGRRGGVLECRRFPSQAATPRHGR